MVELRELVPLTELLYACWIVSGSENTHKETMPTAPGVLEYGLHNALKQGAFPDWVKGQLHFVSADTGLACLELPLIQRVATELKLTSDPNPSYTRTEIVVSKALARRCLSELEVSEDQAKKWGTILRDTVAQAEEMLAAHA